MPSADLVAITVNFITCIHTNMYLWNLHNLRTKIFTSRFTARMKRTYVKLHCKPQTTKSSLIKIHASMNANASQTHTTVWLRSLLKWILQATLTLLSSINPWKLVTGDHIQKFNHPKFVAIKSCFKNPSKVKEKLYSCLWYAKKEQFNHLRDNAY